MKKFSIVLLLIVVLLTACASGGNPSQSSAAAPAAPQSNAPAVPPTATPAAPENIPIMPGATDLNISESAIGYYTKGTMQQVIDYYSKEMVAKGWRVQEQPSVIGTFGRMNFALPNEQVSFMLMYSEPLNQVQVRMTIIFLNVASPTLGK